MHVGWIMDSRDHSSIAEGDEGAAAMAAAPPAGSAAATPPISTGIAIGGGHRQQLGRRDSFSESVGSLGSR